MITFENFKLIHHEVCRRQFSSACESKLWALLSLNNITYILTWICCVTAFAPLPWENSLFVCRGREAKQSSFLLIKRKTADLHSSDLFLFIGALFFLPQASLSSVVCLLWSAVIFHLLIFVHVCTCTRVRHIDWRILYVVTFEGNLYNKRLCKNHRTTWGHYPAHQSS